MSAPLPTHDDIQAAHDFAKARGLGVKFFDAKRNYLIIVMPQAKAPPATATPTVDSAAPSSEAPH